MEGPATTRTHVADLLNLIAYDQDRVLSLEPFRPSVQDVPVDDHDAVLDDRPRGKPRGLGAGQYLGPQAEVMGELVLPIPFHRCRHNNNDWPVGFRTEVSVIPCDGLVGLSETLLIA